MRRGGTIALRRATHAPRTAIPAPFASSSRKLYSTTGSAEPAKPSVSSRWLSDVKTRIGHCITFGLKPAQTVEAGSILDEITRDWRELMAGSEGYLTDKFRRSLFRRPVAWGDMDSMGHVNNTIYNRYAETGRIEWASKYARYIDPAHADYWRSLALPIKEGLLLRRITTEYKFPMKYPDHITVYHRLASKPLEGTDTFDMHAIIISELHQRTAAKVIEDCVLYDYRTAKKTPLRPFMLEVLQETWRLQEEAKRINSQRVIGLLERVRNLETDSWDRADAVEDMGIASK